MQDQQAVGCPQDIGGAGGVEERSAPCSGVVPRLDPAPTLGCSCDTCRRLVAGSDGDVKVCIVHQGVSLVLCAGCFRRDPRRDQWLEWNSSFSPEPNDLWSAACGPAVEVW